MEVIPGIHSVPVGNGAFMGTFPPNVYLVLAREVAFIDTGHKKDAHVKARLDYLESLARTRVDHIILTHHHPDHSGEAEAIQRATGAKIWAYREEGMAINQALESTLMEDGAILDLGELTLEFIHTPGHTADSMCIYMRERGVLFSGDHVLGMGTTVISPPDGDMARYIESLRKLLAYDIKVICPGHGPIVRQPKKKLKELIQHRLEREQQVLAYLKEGEGTVERLVGEIYPELDKRLLEMAKSQVLAHLIKLEKEGRVVRRGGLYRVA